jgi:hypothetical protein
MILAQITGQDLVNMHPLAHIFPAEELASVIYPAKFN